MRPVILTRSPPSLAVLIVVFGAMAEIVFAKIVLHEDCLHSVGQQMLRVGCRVGLRIPRAWDVRA